MNDSVTSAGPELLVLMLSGFFDCKQMSQHTHTHTSVFIPAKISSKDVKQLVPVYERMKDSAIRAIDHVALVGGPPRHLPVGFSEN